MRILKLTLTKKWFDMILSGEKLEEYREIKLFWIVRFLSNVEYLTTLEDIESVGARFISYDAIEFTNGYGKHRPSFLIKLNEIAINTSTHPEWGGDTDKKQFILKLGEILTLE